jgi:hypothetical protein
MLGTIAAVVALGCVSAQALILSSNPAESMTINKCKRSSDGTLVCEPACPVQGQSGDAVVTLRLHHRPARWQHCSLKAMKSST